MTDPALSKDHVIRKRVLVGTLSNYAGQLVSLGTLFLLTPFILRQLGDTAYGLWVLIGSVVAYGGLLDFGIWGTLIKYIAEFRARGEDEKARSLVVTALRAYALIGLLVMLLSAAVAPAFPALFKIPQGEEALAVRLVLLMGIGVGIAIPGMAPMAILRGLQRYDTVNLVDGFTTLYTAAATVLVLRLGGGVTGLVLVNISGIVVLSLLASWCVGRIAPELRLGWRQLLRGADRSLVPMIFSYSWPLFVKEAAGRLQTKTDEITISIFLPIYVIPPYNLARRLSETTSLLTKQFIKVLLPLASELHAENDRPRMRALFVAGTRLNLSISLAIGCTVIVLAGPILTVWVGETYASAAPLVAILTTAAFLAVSLWPAGVVLQGMARHRVLAFTALGSGISNLILSILLIGPFGLTGVAFGTLLPNLIEFFIILPFTLRLLQVSALEALREIFLPALSPAALMVLTLLAVRRAVEPASLITLGITASLGLAVFAISYLSIGANRLERQTVRGAAFTLFRFAKTYFKRTG